MKNPPNFFEPIRLKAAQRWNQLEKDPELAGPWHQLFKQVQSPRHVLSELLQNADDAGATEASVRIESDVFIFEHNGDDFTEENFASLCRFGYSNKRALHTIGFRGIGFKSTFSLGNRVQLFTPTLSVTFHRRRFTEPHWQAGHSMVERRTRICVAISDHHRRREIEKNLEEWIESPVSLLFFKHIRQLRIGNSNVHWGSMGDGPVPNSEWMAMHGKEDTAFLLIRSEPEPFPAEALEEIRQERLVGTQDEVDFPPCSVEIVLGAKGRLFVVLPTGVQTSLPFACNAPFVQDPARLKIKDPEISPTNRWLLERTGQLAASAMIAWVQQSSLPISERVGAYELLPDIGQHDSSLESGCSAAVAQAFATAANGHPLLLTDDNAVTLAGQSVILPAELFDIWPNEQTTALFDSNARPPLSRHIAEQHRKRLLSWNFVEQISKKYIIRMLYHKNPPKPSTWQKLLDLWAYIAPDTTQYSAVFHPNNMNIMPVQGKDMLYSAQQIVRLGEKKLVQSNDDWEFLSTHMLALDQEWIRFLAERRRSAATTQPSPDMQEPPPDNSLSAAEAILQKAELSTATDVNKVIDHVARAFFSVGNVSRSQCVQLAQIAAKLNVRPSESFRYVTAENYIQEMTWETIFDENGEIKDFLPERFRVSHLLHPDYTIHFTSCSRDEWNRWVASGRSGLNTFVPLMSTSNGLCSYDAEREARKHGFTGAFSYKYKTDHVRVEDWNFQDDVWNHWQTLAKDDDQLWVRIAGYILRQRPDYWNKAQTAKFFHIATTGSKHPMTDIPILPTWILKLREVPCLRDTRGIARKPDELLRRTPQTEPLLDVEPFIESALDTEQVRPLLKLLGVRDTPTGPDRILERLRGLSKTTHPPIGEVEKWYRRLDDLINTCSSTEILRMKLAFQGEKILLAHDGTWTTSKAVYMNGDDDDVPGISLIRPSVRELSLWQKIGVAERPTAEVAVQWLKGLQPGIALSSDDQRRVQALLKRYPEQIWDECGCWLNLDSEWSAIKGLRYSLSMQTLVPWNALYPQVKKQTADLRMLPRTVTSEPPFRDLRPLAQCLEQRPHISERAANTTEEKGWIKAFGTELQRIKLPDEQETQRIRDLARRLTQLRWCATSSLKASAYLNGTPAGTPQDVDILWFENTLFVKEESAGKLAKLVPDEISKAFNHEDISQALAYSFDRDAGAIRAYIADNFQLAPDSDTVSHPSDAVSNTSDVAPADELPVDSPQVDDGSEDGARIDPFSPPIDRRDTSQNGKIQGKPAKSHEPAPQPVHMKPDKVSLIERFATVNGYRERRGDRFCKRDGSYLEALEGAKDKWQRVNVAGNPDRYYWIKEQCLDRDPLILEADIWSMLDERHETHSLILMDLKGEPIEITGSRLRVLLEEKTVTLYPASYRLVQKKTPHA